MAFSAAFNLSLFSLMSLFKAFICAAKLLASALFLPCSRTTFLYAVCRDFNFEPCSDSSEFSLSSGAFDFSSCEFTSFKLLSILESSASALFRETFQPLVFLSFSPYFSLDCASALFKTAIFSFCFSIWLFKSLL